MTKQNLDLINRVINTLMLIDTHGENSFAMVQCISSLRQVVENETTLAKERACAPVMKEE